MTTPKENSDHLTSPDYIVVQAGGQGSRLGRLTRNKPKALVPVENLPMIFHLFRAYPSKKFIVIGDYKFEVLSKYLAAFADVDYKIVCATGHKGTCAGLSDAAALVPDGESFALIWCDLVLSHEHDLAAPIDANVIGISKDFQCRWSYKEGSFEESPSSEQGVAGYFVFKNKEELADVPLDGEFVQWLQSRGLEFSEQPLFDTHEFGAIEEWEKLPKALCRPFNTIEFKRDHVVKVPLDEQGCSLAVREAAWYRKVADKGLSSIPKVYSFSPLSIERIYGGCAYECQDMPISSKRAVLKSVVRCLREVHALEDGPVDLKSYHEAYVGKTYTRLDKVQKLVPFANEQIIKINGRSCRNPFFCRKELEEAVMRFVPDRFRLIHGDCTFSNVMLRDGIEPVLIDPRGYFGTTEFLGDVAYDWVKLYYSLASNYDQFNLKRFDLNIGESSVEINVESNGWEELEDDFFELLREEVSREQMRVLLAVTWLSLTTYAWEDYDSICGAFYIGTYYLEEALS